MKAELGTVAGYRLLSLLGRGGMSTVYLAEDMRLRRKVAVKILSADLAEDPAFRERFVRESRLAASLDHPNIVPIFEAGEADEVLYIVMRNVEGADLKSMIRQEGPLGLDHSEEILRQVAAALDVAHAQDLVHRDVKPGNILVTRDSNGRTHAYLSDFGLTKRADSKSALTATGTFVGTINYTSPEQIKAERLDGRADLYSLACVSYECLTGVVPFPREVEMAVLWAHMQDPPPRVSERRPDLPPAVDGVIARGLAKVPEDRFGSCSEFVEALVTCVAGKIQRFKPPQRRPAREARVMLAHDPVDAHMVVRLAEKLEQAGLTTMAPAEMELEAADSGTYAACCMFIGGAGLGEWDRRDIRAAREAVRSRPHFRVIPVLLPGVSEPFEARSLPPFLATRPWVDLRRGLEDPRGFQALVDAITKGSSSGQSREGVRFDVPPYRGLRPFEEDDAVFFFGREADIQRLLEELKASRFLAVLGPSGSGKSSLIRAGLVPSLRAGTLPGSERWEIRVIKPGALPLFALASELVGLNPSDDVESLHQRLSTDPTSLHLASALSLVDRDPESCLVWVIDQIEEIFTLCRDEKERRAFVDNLVYAALVPGGRAVVILTMRADFYPHCAAYPELAQAIAARQFLVSPMDREGLRRAIEAPATLVGLSFEEGLVESILDDVGSEPGSLPLLEHAMYELWERRRGAFLTLENYVQAGGVQGALANRAEAIYAAFDEEQAEICRRIMLRLTRLGEGTEDTRRRARASELLLRAEETEATEAVTSSLVAARLLTIAADPESGETLVDVSHEALIRAWPRLRAWIDEDRAGLAIHRHITEASIEWKRLEMDESLLYRGARLAETTEWRVSHGQELNELEEEFLAASARAQQQEIHRVRRTNQRLRSLLVGVGVFLLLALIGGILAFVERGRAVRQSALKEEQADMSLSRQLASQALLNLDRRPDLAVLLALEGYRVAATTQARESLLATAQLTGAVEHVLHTGGDISLPTLSPDGTLVAGSVARGTVSLFNLRTDDVKEIEFGNGRQRALRLTFDRDGQQLAIAYGGVVAVHEVQTGTLVSGPFRDRPYDQASNVQFPSLAFGPRGKQLIGGGTDGVVRVWDVRDEKLAARLNGRGPVTSLDVSPGGQTLATATDDGAVALWNTANWSLKRVIEGRQRFTVDAAFSPDGRVLAAAGSDGLVRWNVQTGRRIGAALRGHDGEVNSVTFSADGKLMATGGTDGTTRLWDPDAGTQIGQPIKGHDDSIEWVAFTPDSSKLVVAPGDSIIVWSVDGIQGTAIGDVPNATAVVEYSRDGSLLAVGGATDGHVYFFDPVSGRRVAKPLEHSLDAYALSFAPNGILAASDGSLVRVWDPFTGREVTEPLSGPGGIVWDVAFSPDGRLLAVATEGERIVLRDSGSWDVVGVIKNPHGGPTVALAFSADGMTLISAGAYDLAIKRWSVDTLKQIGDSAKTHRPLSPVSVAVSPDGKLVAASGQDQPLSLYAADLTPLPAFETDVARTSSVAFSPDGGVLAAGGDDGSVRLWDVATGSPLGAPLGGHRDWTYSVAFSPDGESLVSGGQDGAIRIWSSVLWADELEIFRSALCPIAARNLTAAEWETYLPGKSVRNTCPRS